MAKLHFRSYTTNQMVLFPQRIDENIAENDPVRIVSSIVDHLDRVQSTNYTTVWADVRIIHA